MSPEQDAQLRQIADTLRSDDGFLVASHHGPDGDAIGSLLAVGKLLDCLGKRYCLFNTDGVPDQYRFLPGSDQVTDRLPGECWNWLILLDVATPDRIDEALRQGQHYARSIVLDHHLTERPFGDLAYVDAGAAATGEIVVRLRAALAVDPGPDFATCAYAAIFADTGSFQFSNTNDRVLRIAAELAAQGADPAAIADALVASQSLARVRMMERALHNLEILADGRVATISVFLDDMQAVGATRYDLEGLVNLPRSIAGVRVAAQLREVIPGQEYRISLRSKVGYDVEAVARKFGGGGHRQAAGCTIRGSYEAVCAALYPELERAAEPRQ
ncbi:MAG: bifunctional oligoribonuclease/PAP phosphatase NrnA [Candidatus Dadabacteria bacterium]|nr:MAG: bifunctional oligoribonuclease/PAP phosphatase NrnA [Candidatus Dadabacteria bacterium]